MSESETINAIGRAFRNDRVTELSVTLAKLVCAGCFDAPEFFAAPSGDRYGRHLIWRDDDLGFAIIGMTWAPGQSAPLHDHDGLWGAEAVVEGTMRETPFTLVDADAEGRCRFIQEPELLRCRGDVGTVIAPREYHAFGNAGETAARTVHVYSAEIARCRSYIAEEGGWWRPRATTLRYDV
jgi:predicted metal-dependent enzyme (double-stranded beta helix superfamily)